MALVIDEQTFYATILLLIIVNRIVATQGGFRIVFWRIRGVKWFMRTEVTPDNNAVRKALKMKIVKTHSPPMYEYNGKEWFTGGPDETARLYGAPNWVYRYDDARPLPLKHKGDPIDPTLIHSAFQNQSIEKFNRLGQPKTRKPTASIAILVILILAVGFLTIYYTWYFGYNANCALQTRVCP